MKEQLNRVSSQSSRFWIKMGVALALAVALVSGVVFFVFAATTPVITTVAGGINGSWVQVRIDNLPANVDFVVYEGAMGSQGVGGSKVAGFNSLSGGTQFYRFEVATNLLRERQFDIRIVGSDGSVGWQTVGLPANVGTAAGTRAAGGNVPVTGATATPLATAAAGAASATPLATTAAGAASATPLATTAAGAGTAVATTAAGAATAVATTAADTATPLATTAATATPLATATTAAGAGTAVATSAPVAAGTATPLATTAAGAATATPLATTAAGTATPLATTAAGAATATPLATAAAATATPLATAAAGATATPLATATAVAPVTGATATAVPTTAAGGTAATPVAGGAVVPVTGPSNITNMTFSNQIMMTRNDFGGVVSFLISNLPLNTEYLVRIGPANQNGENGYVVAHFNTGNRTQNVATFEVPVLLRRETQLDLRMDAQNQIIVKTFPNAFAAFPAAATNRTVPTQ